MSLFATAALAKGASSAVIQGPGLAHPLTIVPPESGVDQLLPLMHDSGFWLEACGHCRGVVSRQPSGDLGPRYTVTYAMGLETTTPSNQVVQYVFPFAQPQPVTYMPGGGWYVAHPRLKGLLFNLGLPATVAEATQISGYILRHRGVATAAPHGSSVPWVALVALIAAAGGLLVL